MAPLPAPPQAQSQDQGISSIPRSTGERAGGLLQGLVSATGSPNQDIESHLAEHYQRRLDEARMHKQHATTYATALAMINRGVNPETGQPFASDAEKQAAQQKYQNYYDSAFQSYAKAAGVSKESKGAIAKAKAIVDKIIHGGQAPGAAGGQGAAEAGRAGLAEPPQAQSQQAQGAGGAGAPGAASQQLTPPPSSMYSAQQADTQAPALEQSMGDERTMELERGKESAIAEGKALGERKGYELRKQEIADLEKQGVHLSPVEKAELLVSGKLTGVGAGTAQKVEYVLPDGTHGVGSFLPGKGGEPSVYLDQDQNPLPAGTTLFHPSLMPSETTSQTVKLVPQADGSIAAVPVTSTSERVRGGVGAATTPTSAAGPSTILSGRGRRAGGGAGAGAPGRIVGARVPTEVKKSFDSYNAAQERYTVMLHAMPKALEGDQQAQLNILANHLGMTSGLQKGARINQAMWNEAMESAPWWDRVMSKFTVVDPQTGDHIWAGARTGVTLTPGQIQQMVGLAKDRRDQDYQSYKRETGAAKGGYGMGRSMAPPPEAQSASGGKDYGPAPAGRKEGSTGTLPDGTLVVVRHGRIVEQ